MLTEVASRAGFSEIRYAQCWEDADVLVEALQPAGKMCVSIASAGDNALALLAAGASRVVALDLNPAQLACVELRKAAYLRLDHEGLLTLIGSRDASSDERAQLYARCREALPAEARAFWDSRPNAIREGIGGAGKFENYFRTFRQWVMPFIHGRRRVDALIEARTLEERRAFYEDRWDCWRWRALFRVFFSRRVMGALGRDAAFFRYVQGSVSERILARTRHALAELDPADNPYLHWILKGRHGAALPRALRAEHFSTIRAALAEGRLETRLQTVEDFLAGAPRASVDAFNLSDIFEYMSEENTERILRAVVSASKPGARIAYWNMLVPRSHLESLAARVRNRADIAEPLFLRDKAWFYSRFVVEEVLL